MVSAPLPAVPAIVIQQQEETKARQAKAQKLFEEILKNQKKLKTMKEEMKGLCQIENGYEEAQEKRTAAQASLRQIVTVVENRNPEMAEEISQLKAEIKNDQGILDEMLMLEFMELSKSVNLDPRQMSLFDDSEQAEYVPIIKFKFDKITKENEKQNVDLPNDLEDETV